MVKYLKILILIACMAGIPFNVTFGQTESGSTLNQVIENAKQQGAWQSFELRKGLLVIPEGKKENGIITSEMKMLTWDAKNQKLIIGEEKFGVKPIEEGKKLYTTQDPNDFDGFVKKQIKGMPIVWTDQEGKKLVINSYESSKGGTNWKGDLIKAQLGVPKEVKFSEGFGALNLRDALVTIFVRFADEMSQENQCGISEGKLVRFQADNILKSEAEGNKSIVATFDPDYNVSSAGSGPGLITLILAALVIALGGLAVFLFLRLKKAPSDTKNGGDESTAEEVVDVKEVLSSLFENSNNPEGRILALLQWAQKSAGQDYGLNNRFQEIESKAQKYDDTLGKLDEGARLGFLNNSGALIDALESKEERSLVLFVEKTMKMQESASWLSGVFKRNQIAGDFLKKMKNGDQAEDRSLQLIYDAYAALQLGTNLIANEGKLKDRSLIGAGNSLAQQYVFSLLLEKHKDPEFDFKQIYTLIDDRNVALREHPSFSRDLMIDDWLIKSLVPLAKDFEKFRNSEPGQKEIDLYLNSFWKRFGHFSEEISAFSHPPKPNESARMLGDLISIGFHALDFATVYASAAPHRATNRLNPAMIFHAQTVLNLPMDQYKVYDQSIGSAPNVVRNIRSICKEFGVDNLDGVLIEGYHIPKETLS